MKVATPLCQAAIAVCNLVPHATENYTVGDDPLPPCLTALESCDVALVIPYQASGRNPYDMRIPCEHGKLCYDLDNIGTFLNTDSIQEQLGTTGKWSSCNVGVSAAFEP